MIKTVEICLGSSCFVRGNKNLITFLKDVVSKTDGKEGTQLTGSHCLGECDKGPNIKINDLLISNITKSDLMVHLKEELSKGKVITDG